MLRYFHVLFYGHDALTVHHTNTERFLPKNVSQMKVMSMDWRVDAISTAECSGSPGSSNWGL